jgi:hypothetical protein
MCKCLERVHQLVAIHQFQSQEKWSAAKKDTQSPIFSPPLQSILKKKKKKGTKNEDQSRTKNFGHVSGFSSQR